MVLHYTELPEHVVMSLANRDDLLVVPPDLQVLYQ